MMSMLFLGPVRDRSGLLAAVLLMLVGVAGDTGAQSGGEGGARLSTPGGDTNLAPGSSGGASSKSFELTLEDRNGAAQVLQVPAVTPVTLLSVPAEALTGLPAGLSELAQYGALRHGSGDGIVSMLVDPGPDGEEQLIVDQNDDEDLSNDPVLHWRGDYAVGNRGQALLPAQAVECVLSCPGGAVMPIQLRLWRFERSRVEGRTAITLRNGILVSIETYRQGEMVLGEARLAIAVVPTVTAGRHGLFSHPANALVVDLNGDGRLDGRPMRSPERFRLGSPFRIRDRAFKVIETSCDGRRLTLAEIDPAEVQARRRAGSGPMPGEPAPRFKLATIDGDTVRLETYAGKVVLLDFWATWCGPCRVEMPYVKRAYQRYHDQGFEIIGISLDNRAEIVRRFAAKNGMPWPQVLQGRGSWTPLKADYGVRSIPSAFLIDGEGRVIARGLRGERLVQGVATAVSRTGKRSD